MTLYLTYCCAEKRQGVLSPKELYLSDRIYRFIDYCEANEQPWAILSAEYGLFFPDERHQDYDTTFKSDTQGRCRIVKSGRMLDPNQSSAHVNNLVATIQRQANVRGVKDAIFYAPAPKMAKCYFLVLHRAIDGCTKHHGRVGEIRDHIRISGRIKHVTKLSII